MNAEFDSDELKLQKKDVLLSLQNHQALKTQATILCKGSVTYQLTGKWDNNKGCDIRIQPWQG